MRYCVSFLLGAEPRPKVDPPCRVRVAYDAILHADLEVDLAAFRQLRWSGDWTCSATSHCYLDRVS